MFRGRKIVKRLVSLKLMASERPRGVGATASRIGWGQ